jgi:hypothetical protein
MPHHEEQDIASKLRAIRRKNAVRVLLLSQAALKVIREIEQIEAVMAAEAAAVAQCDPGPTFEAIYRHFVADEPPCANVFDALEKDAAAA